MASSTILQVESASTLYRFVSSITVVELTKRYSVLALSTGRIVELAVVTALLYLCMSWPLAMLSRWFEQRLERPAAGHGLTEG
jgi:ABC-type amino acid transport system permease subunit